MKSLSFTRILQLVKKELIEKRGVLLYGFLVMCVIVGLVAFIPVIYPDNIYSVPMIVFFLCVVYAIFGSIFANFAFSSLAEKPAAISMLTLPATHFEKVFAKFLIYTVFYSLVFTIVAYLLVHAATYTYEQLYMHAGKGCEIEQINTNAFADIKKSCILALAIQCFFYYGAITFKKYTYLISMAMVFLLAGIYIFYISILHKTVSYDLPEYTFKFLHEGMIVWDERKTIPVEKLYMLPAWLGYLKELFFTYLLGPMLFVLTWLKLKERQLK